MCVARSCVNRHARLGWHLRDRDADGPCLLGRPQERPRLKKQRNRNQEKTNSKQKQHHPSRLRKCAKRQSNDSRHTRCTISRPAYLPQLCSRSTAQSLLGSVSDSFGLVELDKFALEPCVEPRPGHFAIPPHPCVLPAGYQSDCCVCWFCRTSKASVSSSDGWLWPG